MYSRHGKWSEWKWSSEYERYYRQRLDPNGEYETEWDPRSAQTATVDEETPRETAIDDLADDLAGLQTTSAGAAYDPETEYAVSSAPRNRNKGKSSHSRGKRPNRAENDPDVPNEEAGGPSRHYKSSGDQRHSYYDPETGQYLPYSDHPDADAASYGTVDGSYPTNEGDQSYPNTSSYQSGGNYQEYPGYARDPDYAPDPSYSRDGEYREDGHYSGSRKYPEREPYSSKQRRGSRYAQEDPAYETDNPDLQAAMEASRLDGNDPDLQAAMGASRREGNYPDMVGESSASAYAYEREDEGVVTPRAAHPTKDHITATEGHYEQLDPRYRVEHSSRFQPGEIFKVLWSEPQGAGGNDGAPSVSDRREFRDRFGAKFFVGFRRFIVIANDHGHCTCVPILTYGGKGCKKKGVKPEKHGVIHEKGQRSRLLKDEPKLGFPPAKVEITEEFEKLSKESRVNYSKLVTVEHNVKVFFIGHVVISDWDVVSEAVNRCWEEKIHHKRRYFK